jgi:hypothetical protein
LCASNVAEAFAYFNVQVIVATSGLVQEYQASMRRHLHGGAPAQPWEVDGGAPAAAPQKPQNRNDP